MSARPAPIHWGTYGEIAAVLAARIASQRAGEWFGAPIEIIVPSRSASEEIARRTLAGSAAIAGLQTVPIERFALRVLNDSGRYPRVADEAESSLAMELALRAAGGDLASIHGATSMLWRTHRDLRDSGVAIRGLAKRVARLGGLRNRERLLSAVAVWERFEKLLDEAGATVEADILIDAATRIRNGARVTPQIVFGFYDATEVQLDLLRALAFSGLVDSIWLPALLDETSGRPRAPWSYATPFVERLLEAGAVIAGRAATEQTAQEWAIRDFPSPLGEIREVCRAIRARLDSGERASSIAVVSRAANPADAVLFEQEGRSFELTFRGTPGTPVIANRIARGVLSILRLAREGMPRRDVIEIVRSGLRPGALGTVPPLDDLERATRRAKIARGTAAQIRSMAKTAQAERGNDEPDPILLDYASLVERLATLTRRAALQQRGSGWADDLDRWVSLFAVETDEDIDVVVRMQSVAALLRRAPFATARLGTDDIANAIAGSGEIARPEDSAAVWIGDVMRFRGRTAKHLFVVCATHDSLPQRRVDDPLLSDLERGRLGIRAVGDGREEERFLFASLLASATTSIHFSFASADGVGKALRPSSFLKDFAIERVPEDRGEILRDFRRWLRNRGEHDAGPRSAQERRTAELLASPSPRFIRQLQLAAMRGSESSFDAYLATGETFNSRLRAIFESLSPSSLEHLGLCPHRFFMSALLGAGELEEPEAGVGIETRDKGTIDHTILERFYRGLSTEELTRVEEGALPDGLARRLAEEVRRVFEEFDTKAPPLNTVLRGIEREATIAALADFVAADMFQLAADGFRPSDFELQIESADPAARIDVAGASIGVRGRIDRIDHAESAGAWRVVDYKSGKAGNHENLRDRILEGKSLQIAIYALVAKRLRGAEAARVSARILPLRNPVEKPEKFSFNLGEIENELHAVLETLVGAARAGRFPAVPSADACKYCHVRHWCRERHDPSPGIEERNVLDLLREAES